MTHLPFILAAYAMSAFVLGGLALWIVADGRRTRAALERLEATAGRRGRSAQ